MLRPKQSLCLILSVTESQSNVERRGQSRHAEMPVEVEGRFYFALLCRMIFQMAIYSGYMHGLWISPCYLCEKLFNIVVVTVACSPPFGRVLQLCHYSKLNCAVATHFISPTITQSERAWRTPALFVSGCLGHVSPLMCAHQADNVTQVWAKGQPPLKWVCGGEPHWWRRYFPCQRELYRNVIFITNERDMPHCIRRKSDLMWCTAACQKQCYLGHPDSPICSVF